MPDGLYGPEQNSFWKLTVATNPCTVWHGDYGGTKSSPTSYSLKQNASYYTSASVQLPYVVAIGKMNFNMSENSLSCIDCQLYTYVNSSVSLVNKTLLILRSQECLWLPVQMHTPWEESSMICNTSVCETSTPAEEIPGFVDLRSNRTDCHCNNCSCFWDCFASVYTDEGICPTMTQGLS